MTKAAETIVVMPKVRLDVVFDTVRINIGCSSEYQAQVLFDDLVARLSAGEEITVKGNPK